MAILPDDRGHDDRRGINLPLFWVAGCAGVGMALGSGLGAALSNIGLGIGLGAGIGCALGLIFCAAETQVPKSDR